MYAGTRLQKTKKTYEGFDITWATGNQNDTQHTQLLPLLAAPCEQEASWFQNVNKFNI